MILLKATKKTNQIDYFIWTGVKGNYEELTAWIQHFKEELGNHFAIDTKGGLYIYSPFKETITVPIGDVIVRTHSNCYFLMVKPSFEKKYNIDKPEKL